MTTLPNSTKAEILRDLATHPKMRAAMGVVALRHDVTAAVVSEIAKTHGYPDKQSMWAAAERLRATGETPDTTSDGDPIVAVVPTPRPGRPLEPPRQTPGGMVGVALAHRSARVRAAAERVRGQIERLGQLMREEDEKQAARRRRAAELAEAETEIARCVKRLAAARQRLKDLRAGKAIAVAQTPVTSPNQYPLSESGVIRAWARDNDVECPDKGPVPSRVREAYEAAHAPQEAASWPTSRSRRSR